mmetsp:Transcript_24202/g.4044  ORF Transcript_24202/g.4044 Transcript_24202/m.4044 type:complete len:90 (+) Transcript_24202:144-413(+)
MGLFTLTLKTEYVVRVWDNFIVQGFSFMYKTALALLSFNRHRMLLMDFSSIMELLSDIGNNIPSIEIVINRANKYKISSNLVNSIDFKI